MCAPLGPRSACTLCTLGGCGCCDDSLALGARAVALRLSDDGALFGGVGCDRGFSGAVTTGSGPAVAANWLGSSDVCS